MADLPYLVEAADLAPFATIEQAKAEAMIAAATAQAVIAAPCLATELDAVQQAAAKAILVAAITRWNDAGAGGKTTVSDTVGPFSHSETLDTSGQRRGLFWPSEIRSLQAVCKRTPKPFLIDMGGAAVTHRPTCARAFAANYCDCGAELGMDPEV